MEGSLDAEVPEVTMPFERPKKKNEAVAFTEAGFMKAVECIQEYIEMVMCFK